MRDIYRMMTDRIISLIESGTVPWHRPWGGTENQPRSLVSGRPYRGINTFVLASASYDSPYWLTFRQAKERSGHVRKGEKGYPCVFWKWMEEEDEKSGEIRRHPIMRYYTVFNVQQCEHVPYPPTEKVQREFTPIESCERVVAGMPNPPAVHHGGGRAFYQPSIDEVTMPLREKFDSSEAYYSTLFHELVHSTGHSSRLNRRGLQGAIVFGSRTYSKEELIAEMGATFLCGQTGIENTVIDNSASYIAAWLGRLRNDSRLVFQAGGQSQKAVDHILNQKPSNAE